VNNTDRVGSERTLRWVHSPGSDFVRLWKDCKDWRNSFYNIYKTGTAGESAFQPIEKEIKRRGLQDEAAPAQYPNEI
jgi:hypothetical protein